MNSLLPAIRGVIARRILLNFRVKPDVLSALLPFPFRPRLVHGWGIAGICLIRLEHIRPRWLPAAWGMASENAAHRLAVEWDDHGARREGVFIPRRDTGSRFNAWVGGRLFPGVHHLASFWVAQCERRLKLEMRSDDGTIFTRVAARAGEEWLAGSVFRSLAEASDFFQHGSCGWSPRVGECGFDGLELRTDRWAMQPLVVERVESSYFADTARFPAGSVDFDSALLMRGIPHEWRALGRFPLQPARPSHNRHGAVAFFQMP